MTWRGLGAFVRKGWRLSGENQEKCRSMFQLSYGFIGSRIVESMKHVGLGVVD